MNTSTRTTITALIAIGVTLIAALLGFGIGGLIDQVRVVTINSVFGNWETGVPTWIRGVGIPVGILGCILLGVIYTNRTSGKNPFLPTSSLIFLGITIGVCVSVLFWAAADEVGVAADPVFHEDDPWGLGGWIMYSAQWWLPAALLVIAAVNLVGAVRTWARRRKLKGE